MTVKLVGIEIKSKILPTYEVPYGKMIKCFWEDKLKIQNDCIKNAFINFISKLNGHYLLSNYKFEW